jgi:osmoprotectant transport system ATP-binding protein
VIRLEGVTKHYAGARLLGPVSLDVAAHATLALLGPSGCGKSTLLRMVVGLIRPDDGTVRVCDEPMTPETALRLRRRIGYVIQEGGLFPHLSARENATVMARHLGWAPGRIASRVGELAELVRLPPALLARFPAQLSGGERQRVSLMRALFLDPDVLLLDEPLGALDPLVRAQLQQDLRDSFRALRKTVLLVTHDLAEAAFLADDVAVMNAGVVVERGPFAELVARPRDPFVARFVSAQRVTHLQGVI